MFVLESQSVEGELFCFSDGRHLVLGRRLRKRLMRRFGLCLNGFFYLLAKSRHQIFDSKEWCKESLG